MGRRIRSRGSDQPKYVVAVMVQGGEHGGSVAAPIATRILERTLAMDAGNFQAQLAWLAPAHHPNPFVPFKDVTFKDAEQSVGGVDEEHGDDSQATDTQMAGGGGDPDVEQEADAQGKVSASAKKQKVARALPAPTPEQKRGFFQRLFGRRSTPPPAPTPVPRRRP
jgi:hypothetical protein